MSANSAIIYQSIYLPTYASIALSIYLSFYLLHLSSYPPVHSSIHLAMSYAHVKHCLVILLDMGSWNIIPCCWRPSWATFSTFSFMTSPVWWWLFWTNTKRNDFFYSFMQAKKHICTCVSCVHMCAFFPSLFPSLFSSSVPQFWG
jgi:hypothetical protein